MLITDSNNRRVIFPIQLGNGRKQLYLSYAIQKNLDFADLLNAKLAKPSTLNSWFSWLKDMLLLTGSVLMGRPFYFDRSVLVEGEDISVFGLLQYNAEKDSFEMSAIECVFPGGRDRIAHYMKYSNDLQLKQGLLLGLYGAILIAFCVHYTR